MIELTDKTLHVLDTAKGLTVLLLYTKWCPICIRMAKDLRRAEETHNINAVQIDLTPNPKATMRFIPNGVPTILALREGRIVARAKGIVDIEGMIRPLE